MLEAMPIAGKLIKGGFAIPEKLALLSSAALQDMGVEGEETRRKVITAFAGKRTAAMMKAASGGGSEVSNSRDGDLPAWPVLTACLSLLSVRLRRSGGEETMMRPCRGSGATSQALQAQVGPSRPLPLCLMRFWTR